MLKKKELRKGAYYFIIIEGDKWIIKFKRITGDSLYDEYSIDISNGHFHWTEMNCDYSELSELRLATTIEKNWLERCVKEGKFISYNKLNKEIDYEIWN